ncbi:hypothetical protein DPX16_8526 [Anabarilius grahami]|uniref:Uncharacterized protein n=1 Tax=Anabarilius grahami TaxID=495550 RepID=A0A3N0YAF0_ANAGA|nr:hypothetical protein DPX16_8526 [Anabarilius grahami]
MRRVRERRRPCGCVSLHHDREKSENAQLMLLAVPLVTKRIGSESDTADWLLIQQEPMSSLLNLQILGQHLQKPSNFPSSTCTDLLQIG